MLVESEFVCLKAWLFCPSRSRRARYWFQLGSVHANPIDFANALVDLELNVGKGHEIGPYWWYRRLSTCKAFWVNGGSNGWLTRPHSRSRDRYRGRYTLQWQTLQCVDSILRFCCACSSRATESAKRIEIIGLWNRNPQWRD